MRSFQRRDVLGVGLGLAGSGLLAGCARPPHQHQAAAPPPPGYVDPHGPEVAEAERRRGGGPVRQLKMTATESTVDLGGRTVRTWTYGDQLPGPLIRATAGEILEVAFANHLPQATTVHWHGIPIRNDMDGVPNVTQRVIAPGADFTYRFTVQRPGTFWLHPHTGVQQDRGLYAPLIVDDPKEPLSYDHEWVVVLDDWVDGVDGSTPDDVLMELSGGMEGHTPPPGTTFNGPSRRLTEGSSKLLGGHPGDVKYPYYLINGRSLADPETFTAKPGDRVRMRIVNSGGDTAFRVALGGHRMTITHADGRPVVHTTVDALLLGMGERYDVLVTLGDGVFPLVALAEGKDDAARAVLRTGAGEAPGADTRPAELNGLLLPAEKLKADPSIALPPRDPDTSLSLRLTRNVPSYEWGFNNQPYNPSAREPVREGQRIKIQLQNSTNMWHPVHLHGHDFALPQGGPLKDTFILLPKHKLDVEVDADNPGLWMLHCHNIYHSESGMMTVLGYLL